MAQARVNNMIRLKDQKEAEYLQFVGKKHSFVAFGIERDIVDLSTSR